MSQNHEDHLPGGPFGKVSYVRVPGGHLLEFPCGSHPRVKDG